MTIFGFEIDPQSIIESASPVVGRIALIVVIAVIVQNITKRTAGRVLKIAADRHRGEEKEEFEQRIDTISSVIAATIGAIIWATAGFMILSELDINITPILTGAGIAGLAVGFGAQNLVRDIISGVFIIIENQYTKGDVIKVAGLEGLVQEINLRRTVLRDLDGVVHSIPNGEIKVASNLTAEFSKINLNILVEGEKDFEVVTKTINQVGEGLNKKEPFSNYIADPPHVLRVEELAKEGVVLKIVGTTKPIRQWEVMGELRRRLKEEFNKLDTQIYEKKLN